VLKTASTAELVDSVYGVVNGTPMLDKTLSSRLARRRTGPTGREALTSRGEGVADALSRHLVARESHGTPGLPR